MLIGWFLQLLTCALCFNYIFCFLLPGDQTYEARNGHLCYPCNPGYFKVSDCDVDGQKARCVRCGKGEYQPYFNNSTRCGVCMSFCPERQVKVKKCRTTSDIECQCEAGSIWKSVATGYDEGYCLPHSMRGPGEGMVKSGTYGSIQRTVRDTRYMKEANIENSSSDDVQYKTRRRQEEDGGKGTVLETVVLVLVPLEVVTAIVLGCCFYRRRRNKGKVIYAYSKLKQDDIHNGITHNSMANGFHQPGRLNTREIKDMKKKSQYTETHRSKLGDRSATSRVVKGETIFDLSVDAAGVPPKHEVQRVFLSTRTYGENMSDPDDADLTTSTNVCSEIDDSDTGTQPDGNYVPTTTQASSVWPPTSSSAAEVSVWLEVYFFMSRNLSWNKFKMVYRRLTCNTNSELHETVEPDMDNALIEAHSISQEAIYKLMIHWRQATPDAVIIHVFQALEGCQQKLLSEKLQSAVEKTRAPVNIAFGQISDNGQNVVEAPARGELPTSYTLQSVNIDTNGIAANGHCANNLLMMDLKI